MVFIFIILICLVILVVYNPSFDVILVNNKKRPIMWYNSANGRTWIFLW